MRRLIPIIAAIVLSVSGCATYTASAGYGTIQLPDEAEQLPETKLSLIGEIAEAAEPETGNTAEPIPQEEAEKPQEQAEPQEAKPLPEKTKHEEKENLYPAALSLIKFPHLYTPADTNEIKDSNDFSLIVLPLGYEDMEADDAALIFRAVDDLSADFIALTGSLANQVTCAKESGWDAVTLRGGTLLFRPIFIASDGNTARFQVTEDEDIEIAILSMEDSMPADSSDIGSWLASIDSSSDRNVETALSAVSGITDSEAVYIISSPEPSSDDWIALTPYRYRAERPFAISHDLQQAGWLDAYSATHFSAETDGGITRNRGDVYERLDFVYLKGLMPARTVSFSAEGLTGRTGNSAILADIIIP